MTLFGFLVLVSLLLGCRSSDALESEMVNFHEVTSPDGAYVATRFEDCCYCTTGNTPYVFLRRTGEKPAKATNVFVGDLGDMVNVTWTSPRSLLVESYQPNNRLPQSTNIAGITITFKPDTTADKVWLSQNATVGLKKQYPWR